MSRLLNRFVREEQGQDLIEYALLAGLISISSIVGMIALGGALDAKFSVYGGQVTSS